MPDHSLFLYDYLKGLEKQLNTTLMSLYSYYENIPTHPDAKISNNLFIPLKQKKGLKIMILRHRLQAVVGYYKLDTISTKFSITYSKSSSVILVFNGSVISFSNMW